MNSNCILFFPGPECPASDCHSRGAGPSRSIGDQATLKSFQRLFM